MVVFFWATLFWAAMSWVFLITNGVGCASLLVVFLAVGLDSGVLLASIVGAGAGVGRGAGVGGGVEQKAAVHTGDDLA